MKLDEIYLELAKLLADHPHMIAPAGFWTRYLRLAERLQSEGVDELKAARKELAVAREEIVELQTRLADVKAFRERETARADRCLRGRAEEELALEREITAAQSRALDRLESERDAARLKTDLAVTERDDARRRITAIGGAAVRVLNRAFASDPDAVQALVANRVPCNRALADDPTVVVGESKHSEGFTLGPVGLFNGILDEAGLPKLAVKWSLPCEDGHVHLMGFEEYKPAPEAGPV